MLAVRYALMYPRETEQLVLVNPIGLEDWKAKGVPSISIDDWYARELKTSADGIRRYEQSHLLRGSLERRLRAVGADAGGHVSRIGQGGGRVEFGAARTT